MVMQYAEISNERLIIPNIHHRFVLYSNRDFDADPSNILMCAKCELECAEYQAASAALFCNGAKLAGFVFDHHLID
jgi:hypothetical protein